MQKPLSSSYFDQFARGWRGYVIIAFIALCAALPGVGRMPVLDRDEARFTQATRQMLETGDFVRIQVQQDERNKKPIGIHWLQAAAVAAAEPLTDRLNDIRPYRAPSVLGLVLAALATFWGGGALMDRRAALIGAGLFAAGMLAGGEAMIAKTDSALVGFTTLALAALAHLYAGAKRPKLTALLFWFAFGAGVLIKGPVTPIVVTLTLGALIAWERRAAWLKPLLFWPGPLLCVLMVAPWLIAIGLATEGRFFTEAFGEDIGPKMTGGSEGHFAWPGTHLILLPLLIFPATFALPDAFRLARRTLKTPRSEPDALRFLIAWAVPTFLAFELLPTKLIHYPLPTYPAIALLCGAGLMMARDEKWKLTNWSGILLFAAAGLILVGLTSYFTIFMPGDADADMRRAVQAALLGVGVVAAAICAFFATPLPWLRVGAAILAALFLSYTLRERVLPEARTLLVSAEANAALTRARLTPRANRPLWSIGYRETSLVFMTRTDIRLDSPNVAGAEALIGDVMLLESRARAQVEAGLAARGLRFVRAGPPVVGINYGNSDGVVLYLGQVAPLEMPEPTEARSTAAPRRSRD